MSGLLSIPSPAPSPAQEAVWRTAILLLLPRWPSPVPPPWLHTALEDLTAFAGALWQERQRAPSRDRLHAQVRRVVEAQAALREILEPIPIGGRGILPDDSGRKLLERAERDLAGRGQANALDRLGAPTPKAVIALGVVALCRRIKGSAPNTKNRGAIQLCAALLWRARERVGEAAAAMDARTSQWSRALQDARHINPYDDSDPAALTAYAVATALRTIGDQSSDRGTE
jgi:hypothetical protein